MKSELRKRLTLDLVSLFVFQLTNAPKGVVELALEVRDLRETESTTATASQTLSTGSGSGSGSGSVAGSGGNWQRMTAEVKRKMGISNVASSASDELMLRVTTSRMRCSNKVKDELEATASGGVYVKTTVFEHDIYVDAWKSPVFFPSLSTKWDGAGGDEATICVPLRSMDQLENIVIKTTLATKLKMGKKLVLGTVIIGGSGATDTGQAQMRHLQNSAPNERVATWHCYN